MDKSDNSVAQLSHSEPTSSSTPAISRLCASIINTIWIKNMLDQLDNNISRCAETKLNPQDKTARSIPGYCWSYTHSEAIMKQHHMWGYVGSFLCMKSNTEGSSNWLWEWISGVLKRLKNLTGSAWKNNRKCQKCPRKTRRRLLSSSY